MALLGRNQPIGMVFGALLFAFLTTQSNSLTLPPTSRASVVQITQGVAVLAVVIAYELVRRYRVRARAADPWRPRPPDHRGGAGMSVAAPSGPPRRHPGPAARRAAPSPAWLVAARRDRRWSPLVRVVTGADDITSANTIRAAILSACPILLAGIGGLWSERAGVVNIGLEGQMLLGTWGAAYFTYWYGPWVGHRWAPRRSAPLGGLLHALATITFGVDHIVSGVAINIIAPGRDPVPGRGLLHRPAERRARASSPGSTRCPT